MAPYAFRTTDFGRTWTPLVTPADPKGVRGYAHVIRQDPAEPGLLYLGTEFGLWVSIDAGAHWARFKGGQLPHVAVRDLALQPRTNDLVLATHGRGLWIVDDITPWRALARAQAPGARSLLAQDVALIPTGPAAQHLRARGGWASGDAEFVGANPSSGAVITYYQRARHLYGRMTLEILDATGRRVAELPASKNPGLNRVVWSMQEKPPRVPPAAQLAEAGTSGPRVLPGTYTVRLTKGAQQVQMPLQVVLDPQATFTLADRRAQHAAAVRVRELFGEETDLLKRVVGLRASIAARTAELAAADPLHAALAALDTKADALRKQVVATTEGGAITGEERLREHTDQLYGAIVFHEGRPTAYQRGNLEVLEAESERIGKAFDALLATELAATNRGLLAAGRKAVAAPPKEAGDEEEEDEAGGGGGGGSREGGGDPDALMGGAKVPVGFRPMR